MLLFSALDSCAHSFIPYLTKHTPQAGPNTPQQMQAPPPASTLSPGRLLSHMNKSSKGRTCKVQSPPASNCAFTHRPGSPDLPHQEPAWRGRPHCGMGVRLGLMVPAPASRWRWHRDPPVSSELK